MKKTKAKSKETKKEAPKIDQLTIRICENQSLWVVRASITIDFSDYPQLQGMTEDEAKEYINENISEMAPPPGNDYYENLYETLLGQDVVREKDMGSDTSIYFE